MGQTSESSPFQPDILAGKVALITGGGTGIGAGITQMLAGHGADISLASRKRSHLEPTAGAVEALGRKALICKLDVRDRDACEAVVAETLDQFGRLDILINNAAGNFLTRAAELSEKGWRAVVDIVLNGTFNMSQAVYPAMRDASGGSIVNITTTYVETGAPFMAHSGAAKAGVMNLTRTLAVEWGEYGIRVNAVAPGLVEGTEGARRLAESIGIVDDYLAQVPMGRLVRAEDVAAAVLFLCSPAAEHITGIEVTVDGGASIGGLFKQISDRLPASCGVLKTRAPGRYRTLPGELLGAFWPAGHPAGTSPRRPTETTDDIGSTIWSCFFQTPTFAAWRTNSSFERPS